MSSTNAEVDAAWAAQLGPALSEANVARLLGREPADVAAAPELLRLRQCDAGEPVYPAWQFDVLGLVPGVADVVAALTPALDPLTAASWMTTSSWQLNGRPIDVLRAGGEGVDRVLTLAKRLANSAR